MWLNREFWHLSQEKGKRDDNDDDYTRPLNSLFYFRGSRPAVNRSSSLFRPEENPPPFKLGSISIFHLKTFFFPLPGLAFHSFSFDDEESRRSCVTTCYAVFCSGIDRFGSLGDNRRKMKAAHHHVPRKSTSKHAKQTCSSRNEIESRRLSPLCYC